MEGHHNLEASDPRFVRHLEIYKYGIGIYQVPSRATVFDFSPIP